MVRRGGGPKVGRVEGKEGESIDSIQLYTGISVAFVPCVHIYIYIYESMKDRVPIPILPSKPTNTCFKQLSRIFQEKVKVSQLFSSI